jgi:HD superfamily phosphohydrolase
MPMPKLILKDRIYGAVEITQPVMFDLLGTRAVQRLGGVLQHGVTALIGITRPTNRLEHSVGVMALVQRLGGGLEEQIAALLHDVSHTAFSHVIDYVFHSHDSQGYHEEHKAAFVAGSDIPQALRRHGYDWRDFLHEERFPLLEQPAPALCADRLDYFLRDSLDLGLASAVEVNQGLAHLVVHNECIVVDDLQAARWMGMTFIAADQASWANFREVGLYELAAIAIRRGLEIGALSEADLWTTDREAWARLHASPDRELQAALHRVSPETQFFWDAESPTFWVSTKLRTIDPPVFVGGSAHPLSELDAAFACQRQEYLSSKAGKWPVRVVAL